MGFTKKILIAHQSTIPHYRLPFYEELERQRPDWWEFTVLYDPEVSARDRFAPVDPEKLSFKVRRTRTWYLPFSKKEIHLQSFFLAARAYDLIVVEDLLKNVTYPLVHLYRLLGKSLMLWGHGQDLSVIRPRGLKRIYEALKLCLAKGANGYFAYTQGVKDHLVGRGLSEEAVFVLNNTIDIKAQRRVFKRLIDSREVIRAANGLTNAKALLYIGRLNRRKRLDLLVDTYTILKTVDPSYRLTVVGGGDMSPIRAIRERFGTDAVAYCDLTTDLEVLGPLYVTSDAFVFPGDVGLGTLQALCYDLTPVVIESLTHNPEYEYLNEKNAVILPEESSPTDYAEAIDNLLHNKDKWMSLRAHAWTSVQHLTIENMAKNFIRGINTCLGQG